ncbi:thioredoxin domain-containing protein [Arcobacteraceae bacterium]|nr:thioredoxin domain-containing protein [Arcobacteraceae bacterium]
MKLLSLGVASFVLSSTLFATAEIDKKIIDFETNRLSQNPNITLKGIDITTKKALSIKGWYGYVLKIQADVPGRGLVSGDNMLFTNGDAFTMELIDMKTSQSFKDVLMPQVTDAYYKKSHFIAGNENAKNKVVVFSDPLCPACQNSLPMIIKIANDKSKDIALYYYHFPLLSIHPAADIVSRAMVVAKEKGIKDIELKVYATNFSKYFTAKDTDAKIILDGFNKTFNTNITQAELDSKNVMNELSTDVKMGEDVMVQGTPTLFVNGVNDQSRSLFQALAK